MRCSDWSRDMLQNVVERLIICKSQNSHVNSKHYMHIFSLREFTCNEWQCQVTLWRYMLGDTLMTLMANHRPLGSKVCKCCAILKHWHQFENMRQYFNLMHILQTGQFVFMRLTISANENWFNLNLANQITGQNWRQFVKHASD